MWFNDYIMNIGGSEWIIIALICIFLIFGSKKLPQVSRNLGKAFAEYDKTKKTIMNEIEKTSKLESDNEHSEYNNKIGKNIRGPVSSEREKLEKIAISLGIEYNNRTDDEIRSNIMKKMKKNN
ncbi:MAG: twin-arginine translocase TatA/TatE family subunit [Nitrososphaeraceae archaeon]